MINIWVQIVYTFQYLHIETSVTPQGAISKHANKHPILTVCIDVGMKTLLLEWGRQYIMQPASAIAVLQGGESLLSILKVITCMEECHLNPYIYVYACTLNYHTVMGQLLLSILYMHAHCFWLRFQNDHYPLQSLPMRLGRLVFWWCTAQSLILFIFGGVCYITSNDLESVVGGMTVTRNSRPHAGSVIVLCSNLFVMKVFIM